jgi:hypothetical protein
MTISKRKLILGSILTISAYPALAQLGALGGLLGGGSKSAGSDPKKLESDLKQIIESTSFALAKLAEAMGLKETSAKMLKNADDIKSGAIGLSESTDMVSESCASVGAEIAKNQKEGKKLDAASSSIAIQAIEPGIKSFPLWKSVADGIKSLDRSAMMGAAALVQAGPKIPVAAKNSLDLYQTGISYLTFSGADTSSVKKAAESALKF